MTEARQTALFALSILTLVAACGALATGWATLDQYRTDNQTISTLRSQLAEANRYLTETEAAMIQGAKDNEALKDALHLRDLNEALRKEKSRL